MGALILIAMIGVPIAEIAVFIEVGEKIGLGTTLAIVVITAIMGTALLRQQGFSVLARAQTSLQENRFPIAELFDGLCLLFAGALLLTPGFVTDTVGLLLFTPPVRGLLRVWVKKFLLARSQVHMDQGAYSGTGEPRQGGGPIIIDGDFEEVAKTETDDPAEPDPHAKLPPK